MNLKKHRDLVHSHPCVVSGLSPVALHHIDVKRKNHDLLTIPLYQVYHQGYLGIHTMGSKAWEKAYGTEYSLLVKFWKRLPYEYVEELKDRLRKDLEKRMSTHAGAGLAAILEG